MFEPRDTVWQTFSINDKRELGMGDRDQKSTALIDRRRLGLSIARKFWTSSGSVP